MAKVLIIVGSIILFAGLVMLFFGDKLNWLGKLPGDVLIEREHFKFYFPITTMLLVSLILTLAVRLFQRWF
ncbi:MAG: DUF2905 domain-containing protein [Bacteroidota bacterium]